MGRQAFVDLSTITGNVTALCELVRGSQVMAAVKADGYGHGMVPAARAALAGGAGWLGVADLAEALALRQAGIETVARLGARDAIPALKKLARTSLVFNKQGRELRRLARIALARIEGAPAVMDQARKAS